MISIVTQTLEYYAKYKKTPTLSDLTIENQELLNEISSNFVTLYKKGEVTGSAGNIKEIKTSTAEELIANTIVAATDKRFTGISLDDLKDIKVRIDIITERKILKDNELKSVDPVQSGVIAIDKGYSAMACILPKIDPKILTGEDFGPILKEKIGATKFNESDYILYEIKTTETSNF